MESSNKTINKAYMLIYGRVQTLRDKMESERMKLYDRWPVDCYGVKADCIWERKKKEYQEEVDLLEHYLVAWSDLVCIIEGGGTYEKK